MTNQVANRLLAFDYGLSSVRHAGHIARLPDEGTAPATDTRPMLQLEALFDSPSVEDQLLAAVEPVLASRKVLEPSSYVAALDDARDMLATLAAGGHAVFSAAIAVLDAAESDRAVLDTARRALFRG